MKLGPDVLPLDFGWCISIQECIQTALPFIKVFIVQRVKQTSILFTSGIGVSKEAIGTFGICDLLWLNGRSLRTGLTALRVVRRVGFRSRSRFGDTTLTGFKKKTVVNFCFEDDKKDGDYYFHSNG